MVMAVVFSAACGAGSSQRDASGAGGEAGTPGAGGAVQVGGNAGTAGRGGAGGDGAAGMSGAGGTGGGGAAGMSDHGGAAGGGAAGTAGTTCDPVGCWKLQLPGGLDSSLQSGAYVFVSASSPATGQWQAVLDTVYRHTSGCSGGNAFADTATGTVDPSGCHLVASHYWAWSDPSPGFCEGVNECFSAAFSILGDAGTGSFYEGYLDGSSRCGPNGSPYPLTAMRLPAGTEIGPCH